MAGAITDAVLEEIRSRIELSDLVASYGVAVKTAGSSKKACCPFHNEKTPSFHINDQKGFYHCFGCGESGDAIKFVQKMDGLTFVEAVKKLAGQCGVKIEEREDPLAGKRRRLYTLMAELAEFYHRCLLQTKEAEAAREYLKSRDLGAEVQESFLIGYAPTGVVNIRKWAEKHGYTLAELEEAGVILAPRDEHDAGYHRFGGRLMFSIRDKRGRVVAFSGRQLVADKRSGKYVNSPETPIFKKSNVLFGFDKAAGNIAKSAHHEAIVCEGQIDTIRLHVSGFPVAVASQGTAFTEEHAKMLKKVADQVTLVFDDDTAGHKATVRTARLFLAEEMPVRTVSLPDGDDPDSYLRKHPGADFQRLLDGAESIIAFQVRTERAKERDPSTIDAIARVTRAVMETIASAKSAVLQAGMLGEAAKLMDLPTVALEDELRKQKAKLAKARRPTEAAEPPVVDETENFDGRGAEQPAEPRAIAGEDAGAAEPPSDLETEFCAFLLANEYDRTIDGMIGEFLVGETMFAHPYVRRFVDVWRTEVANGGSVLLEWREKLGPREGKWFDALFDQRQAELEKQVISPVRTMEDEYIRKLWCERLRRLQGKLPGDGSGEDLEKRMACSLKPKQIMLLKWHRVKTIIHELIEGGF